jgi:hypothetical protein
VRARDSGIACTRIENKGDGHVRKSLADDVGRRENHIDGELETKKYQVVQRTILRSDRRGAEELERLWEARERDVVESVLVNDSRLETILRLAKESVEGWQHGDDLLLG